MIDNQKLKFPQQSISALQLIDQKMTNSIKVVSNVNIDLPQDYQSPNKVTQIKEDLKKLINFIKFHKISCEDIWQSQTQLSITNFAHKMNQQYGYYLTNQQLTTIMRLRKQGQCVSKEDFRAKLGIWEQDQTNHNQSNLHYGYKKLSSSKIKQKTKYNNIQNNNEKRRNTKCKQKTVFFQDTNFIDNQTKQNQINERGNKRNTFLNAKKVSQAKVKQKIASLKKNIQQNVLQQKWDLIVMAGQMNQWLSQQKKGQKSQVAQQKYKILNTNPITILLSHESYQQILSQIVFIKKYQVLKKKMTHEQNNKNNLKGTVIMVLDQGDKVNKSNLNNKLNQRDHQLDFVLLQVIRMKSILQWQNKMFKDAGVNC